MFAQNDIKNTLNSHLQFDGFFNNTENSLIIIDDYHTKNISQEAINFYVNGFRETGLKNLEIFFQIKKIDQDAFNEILSLSNNLNIDTQKLTSFLVFILTYVNYKKNNLNKKLENYYKSNARDRIITNSYNFITQLENVGINVSYHPYNSLNFNPPFHGRYWINSIKGYIVDGSLDTYTHGKIFAQLMDNENFNIIHNLFVNDITPNTTGYMPLQKIDLIEIHNKLKNYFIH